MVSPLKLTGLGGGDVYDDVPKYLWDTIQLEKPNMRFSLDHANVLLIYYGTKKQTQSHAAYLTDSARKKFLTFWGLLARSSI